MSVTPATGAMAGTRAGTRSFAFWLGAIVALGIAIRVVQTLLVAPWPPGIFNDEAYYRALAHMLADGTGFVRPAEYLTQDISVPTAERAPLYPLVLAGLTKLGAGGADLQRLLGAFTGAGTIAAAGLLGRRLAGERVGLLAAGLAAVYPTLVAADGALMTESLYGMLAALSLVAAYRVLDEPGTGRALVLGAIVGLAALTRGEALVLFPLLLLPLVRRPGGLRAAAVACVAFAVVLAPWTARNWIEFDRPVLVATEGGETLEGANCDPVYYGDKVGSWDVSCVEFSGRGNEAAELDEAGQRGIRYARDHLGRVPVVLAARLGRTWGAVEPFERPQGRAGWVTNLGVAMYYLLLPLAAYGLVLLRRRRVPLFIIAAPLITVTLATLLSYGNMRFRQSAEVALVVLAAIALDRLRRRITVRARGGAPVAQESGLRPGGSPAA